MMQSDCAALSGKRVLVTGGTGFIGRRLVEALTTACNAQVRVMARNFARAASVARFPIELVHGDVTVPEEVERAVEGCEVVFHAAAIAGASAETARAINVGGTDHVLSAALRARVKRVVHVSSLTVYGFPADGDLDESAPRQYQGMNYADTKLDAEKVAFSYHEMHGLPVSIIQPACVYGPFGGAWTQGVLEQLQNERAILVDGGEGLANPVYVDDVVRAILLAAVREEAVGEAFLISDGQRVTWREFYTQYARLVPGAEIISVPADDLVAAHNLEVKRKRKKGLVRESMNILREDAQIRKRLLRTRQGSFAVQVAKPLMPQSVRDSLKGRSGREGWRASPASAAEREQAPSPPSMTPLVVKFYQPKAWVRIEKAERLLGYQPQYTLESGLKRVEEWARWAQIV